MARRRSLAALGMTTLAVCAVLMVASAGETRVAVAAAVSDTVVRMAGAPRHRSEGRLVLDLTIGPTQPQLEFGYISALATDSSGSLWVVDERQPVVRQLSADGKFVRALGRKGRGPGEYTLPRGVVALEDGRVAVYDNGNRRINIYAADGRPVDTWPAGGSSVVRNALAPGPNGGVAAFRIAFVSTGVPSVEDFPERTIIARYSADGGPSTERLMPRPAGRSPYRRIGIGTSVVSFAPRRLEAWSPLGYFVTAFPNRYSFELIDTAGAILSIRRQVAPVPVSAAERRAADAYTERMKERIRPGQAVEPGPPVPANKPFFKNIKVDATGRIWVELHAVATATGPQSAEDPRARWIEPKLFDLFEPDGAYIGRLRAPNDAVNIEISTSRGDYVWTNTRDDDGFIILKRMRIVWPD